MILGRNHPEIFEDLHAARQSVANYERIFEDTRRLANAARRKFELPAVHLYRYDMAVPLVYLTDPLKQLSSGMLALRSSDQETDRLNAEFVREADMLKDLKTGIDNAQAMLEMLELTAQKRDVVDRITSHARSAGVSPDRATKELGLEEEKLRLASATQSLLDEASDQSELQQRLRMVMTMSSRQMNFLRGATEKQLDADTLRHAQQALVLETLYNQKALEFWTRNASLALTDLVGVAARVMNLDSDVMERAAKLLRDSQYMKLQWRGEKGVLKALEFIRQLAGFPDVAPLKAAYYRSLPTQPGNPSNRIPAPPLIETPLPSMEMADAVLHARFLRELHT